MTTRTRPRRASRPRPEPLEGRLALSTFIVSNLRDAGLGSLRQAAVDADASPGTDTIEFAPGLTGTITLTSGSIDLTDAAETAIRGPGGGRLSISGNDASRVFRVGSGATAAIAGLAIVDGRATGPGVPGSGGGILNEGTLAIADCIVSGNTSEGSGGGIGNRAGNLTITGSTVSGNTSGDAGGGILNFGSTMTITGSTVSGNTSGEPGGGIYNYAGPLTIVSSTVSGNTSGGSGGGIYSAAGVMTIVSSTVSGNTSGFFGGGIYNSFGNLTITGSTVSGNTSGEPGGGIYREAGELELNNSIVADNAGVDLILSPIPGTLSGSHNLVEDGVTAGLTDTIAGRDPLLGPLRDNGGPTPTHALLPGSPAIDAGDAEGAPGADQRGVGRVDAADIGAFESRKFTVALESGATQSARIDTAFTSAMVVRVSSAFGEPVAGGRLTLTPPGDGAGATFSQNPMILDALGIATANATANGTAGSYAVPVTAAGVTNAVAFRLTNTVGTTTAVTTDPTVAFSPSAREVTLSATVASPLGTPDAGTVTFSVPGAGPDVTAAVVGGVATATFTVGGGAAPGAYAISARYSGAGVFEASGSGGEGDGTLTVLGPPVVPDQSFTVAENSINGTVVGTVVASDPDAGDALAFAITAGNGVDPAPGQITGGVFAIDPASGQITVADAAALDFEATPVFTLTVRVTDAAGLSDTATVTVRLADVNEPPRVDDQSFRVPLILALPGTAVGAVQAADPDAGDTLRYEIVGGNTTPLGPAFTIDPDTGVLRVANPLALALGLPGGGFDLEVRVSDGGGLSDTAVIHIDVTLL